MRAPAAAPIIEASKPNKEPNTNHHNPERTFAAMSDAIDLGLPESSIVPAPIALNKALNINCVAKATNNPEIIGPQRTRSK